MSRDTIASRIKSCRTLIVSCARGGSAGSVTYHCLNMRLIVYADWFCSLKLKRRPMEKKKKIISTNHDGP
ncbi:hypothetical protein E2C01_038923 [Portunus trituberculatus]|uniref:Uncharacterized protein n=1 Tax=Portunus trituberculatus TaxID=210409 RepID=A0A5B7FC84_PORTR|nr:hypothetical protein [Portunus trituberculatus]